MININRHNYEAFFLLYIDGELSAAEKGAVEQFVQQNPDLAGELEMLQQTLLLPDETVAFTGKTALYRSETAHTTLIHYEEQFLYYIDNELNATAKEQLETFVLQNPALQDAFTLLKQTKLEPETIVFPDKQSLYRTTEKKKPVVYMSWRRMAAAAVVIGLGVLLWTQLTSDTTTSGPITAVVVGQDPLPGNGKETPETGSTGAVDLTLRENKSGNAFIPADKGFTGNGSKAPGPHNASVTQQRTMPMAAISHETTLPELKREETIIARNENKNSNMNEASASKISGAALLAETDMIKNSAVADDPAEASTLIQPVVYKELDTEDDKKSLLLGSVEINKDKLRGFFRKASSIFRSRNRQEDEKPENGAAVNTRSLK